MFLYVMGVLLASGIMTQVCAAASVDPVIDKSGSYLYKTQEPQEISIINVGSLSLHKRLEMIANAKSSIEAEFFIYNIDEAGRLFTQALVKKAHEGVKVRVLVDYGWPIAQLDPYYATLLAQNGIEVRYYNPNMSFELFKGQFRSHRKALVVDDVEGMTGGRNIADEYFDMSAEYNFLDRDILIRGSVARAMRYSFDRFWFSNMTRIPRLEKKPTRRDFGLSDLDVMNDQAAVDRYNEFYRQYEKGMGKAQDYLHQNTKDKQVLESLRAIKLLNTSLIHTHICNDTIFAADMPAIGNRSRILFQEIESQLKSAQKSIYVESPYFVTTKNGMELIRSYLQKGVEVNVYTNSLNSTDAIYTTATFYPRVGALIKDGMKAFIYKGSSLVGQDFLTPESKQARWGIHAKSAVIDEKTIMVGTFNVDPRSRNINAEMAIMCRNNSALAAEVLSSMYEHQQQSVQLNSHGLPVDGSSAFEGVSISKRISYYLLSPLSNLFDFLL